MDSSVAILGAAVGLVLALTVMYFSIGRARKVEQLDQFWFTRSTDEEACELEIVITHGEFAGFVLLISDMQLEEGDGGEPNLSYSFTVQTIHDSAPQSQEVAQYTEDEVQSWDLSPDAEEGTAPYRLILVSQTIVEQLVKQAVEMHEKEQQTK